MKSTTIRQLKDFQIQAERILNSKASLEQVQELDRYNKELKSYLLKELNEQELLERVNQIPRIIEETNNQRVSRNLLASLLITASSGLLTYFQNRQKVENAKANIQEARAKYASIEFLSRNIE